MRKITLILASLAIASSLCAQFIHCNSNTTKSLNDVHFINENVGVAVGDSGIIIRSEDGGNSWTTMIEVDTSAFTKVKFWDNTKGIAIGTEIYSTVDGGLSWKYHDLSKNGNYYDLELFGNNEFLVSFNESIFNRGRNNIIKFQLIDEDIQVVFEDSTDYNITQMSFINDSIGFAHHFEGSLVNSILRTEDGGKNWTKLDFETGEDFTLIEDINFISEDIGLMGGWYNPHLMITKDGGLNWNNVVIKDSKQTLFDLPNLLDFHIDITKSDKFYACGWHGELFKSNDLGSTWEKLASPVPIGTSIKGIYFINDSIGWAVGDYGIVIKTSNGGQLTSTKGFSKHEIDIYPVPFDDVIHLDLPVTAFKTVNLYSATGILLRSSEDNTIENLETLTTGFYLLTIELDHSIQIFKVLKN